MTSTPVTSAAARATLREEFGFDAFRPGQERLVASVLSGRDTLGVLPTGGGKTLCYQLPAFMMPGLVLVASPLISLMQDQVERARSLGLRAASLTSQIPRHEQRRVEAALPAGRLDLLFCSPERLESERLRRRLGASRVSLVTVDEAHCISEWGHDFRPSFRRIHRLRDVVSAPVLAVTATATPAVRDDIADVLRMADPTRVVTSFDRPNIRWLVSEMPPGTERVRRIARTVRGAARAAGAGPRRAVIVYAPTRRTVTSVRRALASLGVPGEAYHAGLPAEERGAVQERFLSGESQVIVATCAFGMGIDRGDVGAVFHYTLPGSVESYYQEAGRAGRDGEGSVALGFVHRGDWRVPEMFVERAYPSPRKVLALHRALGSRRSRPRLDGTELAREGATHIPRLRWLVRAGAVRVDPALGEWLDDWPHRAGDAPPKVADESVRATGREPDLAPLVAGRRQARARLRSIRRYARSRSCRRAALLRYLGEEPPGRRCGSCDRCEGRRTVAR